ncbi:peptide ABC transporter permease [Skermania sp. ID1734]|uniref:ABC transporter permease n=1 Tax=Skermania sp. ID1734 TaxID=2597516 RepID=UPI00117FCA5D|nr:ABC transporter permease [Skermania sp. ID1734]TSE02162.1 peptide ABC transporter permease [Skermania sp. ID1734]
MTAVDTTRTSALALPAAERIRSENSIIALAEQSVVQCKRLVITWLRDIPTLAQALAFPALTLVMFKIVLGDSITMATGMPSVYGQVPMIMLVGAMTGATVSGIYLNVERRTGLLSRFATMPVHRASGLAGRLLAEALRVLTTSIVVMLTGVILGFRFHQGFFAGVALVLLPVLFGVAFALPITAMATVSGGARLVELTGLLITLLMFFNSGFVPVLAYPTWLQSTVANQPMSCAIEAMRGLSLGGPVQEPLLKTVAWCVGLVVVFTYPAVRGYRAAAEQGGE